MAEATTARAPLYITMHECDNVAIVANDGGLAAGTVFPSGLTLVDKVPQGHKVALVDLAAGDPVVRYNVVIGRAARAHSRRQLGPRAAARDAGGARRSRACPSER
jgi:galactarate dehydratase